MPATAQESEEVKDLMLCPPYSGFQARDDKAKQQQFPQEYNDAMWTIDQAGTEKFKDEVLREKIRRSADGGWGDLSADNTRLHIGGDFGEFPDSPEWNLEGLAQQRPTPTLGHTRSMSSLENNAPLLSSTRPRPSGASLSWLFQVVPIRNFKFSCQEPCMELVLDRLRQVVLPLQTTHLRLKTTTCCSPLQTSLASMKPGFGNLRRNKRDSLECTSPFCLWAAQRFTNFQKSRPASMGHIYRMCPATILS
ncbi:hypothetical protein C8R43DRAFT_20564 [Mycena crocata]|nr:hypothetical protein C8R43DRAFT_20564 [Mycena crocata]